VGQDFVNYAHGMSSAWMAPLWAASINVNNGNGE